MCNYAESHGGSDSTWTNSTAKLVATDDITGNLTNLNMTGAQLAIMPENLSINASAADNISSPAKQSGVPVALAWDATSLGGQGATAAPERAGPLEEKVMHLTAQTVTLTNLKNTDKATQDGFSLGGNANVDGMTSAIRNLTTGSDMKGMPPIGSSTVGMSQSGHDKEGYTQNVIGAGLTAGTTSGTGSQTTDASQATVITKDEQRQGFNMNLNSQVVGDAANLIGSGGDYNKVLNDKNGYVGSKVNDIAGLQDTGLALGRTGFAVGTAGKSIAEGGGDIAKTIDRYVDNTAVNNGYSVLSPKDLDVLANPQNYGAADKQAVADKYAEGYAAVRGGSPAQVNIFDKVGIAPENDQTTNGYTKTKTAGFADKNTAKDAYVATDQIQDKQSLNSTLAWEVNRVSNIQKGLAYDTPEQKKEQDQQSADMAKQSTTALSQEMSFKNVAASTAPSMYVNTAADNRVVADGTAKANLVTELEPKIDWDKYVLQNQNVKNELQKLDANLVNLGHPEESFILQVTGGDRYKDPNNPDRILSRTDNTPIGRSKGKSSHLETEGALAVDLVYSGITKSEFMKAWSGTSFSKGFIDDGYLEGPHTHINLPRTPQYKLKMEDSK